MVSSSASDTSVFRNMGMMYMPVRTADLMPAGVRSLRSASTAPVAQTFLRHVALEIARLREVALRYARRSCHLDSCSSGPYTLKEYQSQRASDREFPAATTERPVVIQGGHTTSRLRAARSTTTRVRRRSSGGASHAIRHLWRASPDRTATQLSSHRQFARDASARRSTNRDTRAR